MIKKITIYLLCYLMILINTGCNNQKNDEENLCNQIEKDIETYQNNEIKIDDLYSKLENYQSICINSTDNICITINAIISIPKEQVDIRERFAGDLFNYCQSKR